MAQLRDAVTSELLCEGTPLEVVLVAEQLGRADVCFDGVASEHDPDAFDPDAVLHAHAAQVDGLQTAAAVETDPDTKSRLQAAATEAQAVESLAEQVAPEARALLEAARDRADV
jgi:hypothetical protein